MKCNELQNTEEWQWFRCENSITVVDLVSNVYLFLEVLLLVSHYCIQAPEIVNVLSFRMFFVVYSFDWELVLGMSCLREKKALGSIQAISLHFINYISYNFINIMFIDELNSSYFYLNAYEAYWAQSNHWCCLMNLWCQLLKMTLMVLCLYPNLYW